MNEQKALSILMAGRIYEENEVFLLIQKVADSLLSLTPTRFYLLEALTATKMHLKHPEYISELFVPQAHAHLINYVVTIGGDGTILYAAKQFMQRPPPFVTFQRGSLGFMCRFQQSQIAEVVQAMVSNRSSSIKQLAALKHSSILRLQSHKYVDCKQEQVNVCVNEVCISRINHQRIRLEIFINNEYITETAGDGILISTPTGSTAYSLSAGGPIIQNGINCLLIVPIAPNSLSFRPLCIPSDSTVIIKVAINRCADVGQIAQ